MNVVFLIFFFFKMTIVYGHYSGCTSNCNYCYRGSYSTGWDFFTGKYSCTTCPSGRYTSSNGQSSCTFCSGGQYTPYKTTPCIPCPTGKYALSPPNLGSFSPGNDYDDCIGCPTGYTTYSTQQDSQSDCYLCTAGYKKSGSYCYECPLGYYQSSIGTTSYCSYCNPGYYQHQTAQSVCYTCPKGWYQNGNANSGCISCPSGQYT